MQTPDAPAEPDSAEMTDPALDSPPSFLLARAPADSAAEAISRFEIEPPRHLAVVLESLLLVAEEPPTIRQLAQATGSAADAVEEALSAIAAEAPRRGIRIRRHGETVGLVSAPEAAPYVENFLGLERPNRMSKAALETLAIIAYHQPCTRSTIERIRGVSADGALRTLRIRELVESVGELDGPGRPHLWAVSERFLEHFGMSTLDELPDLPELPTPSEQGHMAFGPQPLGEAAPAQHADEPPAAERTEQSRQAYGAVSAVAGGGGGD